MAIDVNVWVDESRRSLPVRIAGYEIIDDGWRSTVVSRELFAFDSSLAPGDYSDQWFDSDDPEFPAEVWAEIVSSGFAHHLT